MGEQCFCRNADGTGCCPNGSTSQSGPGSARDDNGHGTNVSGIIASAGTLAPVGIAPEAKIVPVRVMDSQNRFSGTAQVLDGLNWILANRPDVKAVNMSLYTDRLFDGVCDNQASYTLAFTSAIQALRSSNVLVFACSGNNGSATQIGAPACVSKAVSVGAVYPLNLGSMRVLGCTDPTTAADKITCFTNSNSTLGLLAPGAPITSTGIAGGTSTYLGTSQATPHATAGAALLWEANRALTPDQVESALKSTGVPVRDERNGLTFPRIDLLAAIQSVGYLRSTMNLSVPEGGSAVAWTAGGMGPVLAGAGVVTVASGTPPYATAVFSLIQKGYVVTEAGVPASPPTANCRLFVDFRNDVPAQAASYPEGTISINTGVALFNPGSDVASVTYSLRNREGNTLATGHGTVPPRGHFARFVDQLSQVAPDFVFPASFPTAVQYGSLQISSDRPLSTLALRLTTNQRQETLLTTVPVADLTKPPSDGPLYFPQLADGGGWQTTVILLNTATAAATGNIRIFDDGGKPLAVHLTDGSSGSTFAYSIPAGGVYVFKTDGSPADIHIGAVQATPDAGAPTPSGAGVFSYSPGGILVTESGVPASPATTHARIYADTSTGHQTGVALFNPGGSQVSVTANAYNEDGVTLAAAGRGPIQLKANGHMAGFLESLVTGLPSEFTGVLDLSSPVPFVPLTLRALNNGRDQIYTTFPVADLTGPAPAPVVFPQIADGGGMYRTQFILLGTAGISTIVLNLYGDDGSPLPIVKASGIGGN